MGNSPLATSLPGPFNSQLRRQASRRKHSLESCIRARTYNAPQIALALATANTEVQVVVPPRGSGGRADQGAREAARARHHSKFLCQLRPRCSSAHPEAKVRACLEDDRGSGHFRTDRGHCGNSAGQNNFSGYGQGAQGYGKALRRGYADVVTGTFIGSAILPSLLKQDPRYFYKGSGSKRSRILYAIANSVICKGDNGRWQANYSNILGSLAAGGISNLYYPAQDRNGAALTFENAAIGIGATAAANLLQEFVIRKLTPNVRIATIRPNPKSDERWVSTVSV